MKYFYAVLVPVLLVLASCDGSLSDRERPYDGLVHELEIISPVPESDITLTKGLTYTGSGVPFAWAERDTVGIFPDHGDQIPFSMEDGIGTTYANLDGGAWGLKASAKYAAYYPFNRWNYFSDRENIILDYTGQVQSGLSNADHLAKYDFQAASFTSASSGKLTFDLKRLNCILILRLTVPQAGVYTDLTLTAADQVFTTKAKLNLGDEYVYNSVTKKNSIHLGLENVQTTENNQVVDFLVMLAPVDLTAVPYTVTLRGANGYLYKGTKTPTSAYAANKVTRTSITLKLDANSNISFGGEWGVDESSI